VRRAKKFVGVRSAVAWYCWEAVHFNARPNNLVFVPALTLCDFERDALRHGSPTRDHPLSFAGIRRPSGSEHGYIEPRHRLLARLGEETYLRQTPRSGFIISKVAPPLLVVTVEATAAGDATAVLYGHLDKQPPLGDWSQAWTRLLPYAAATACTRGAWPTTAYSTFRRPAGPGSHGGPTVSPTAVCGGC